MAINSRHAAGFCLLLMLSWAAASAWAHPGSGIVVDEGGYVWFMDTGYGLWQIDPSGHLTAQAGPARHYLAIDRQERYEHKHFLTLAPGDVEVGRLDPNVIVAKSYVLEYDYVDSDDWADWYPRVRRMDPDGTMTILAQVDKRPERTAAEFRTLPRNVLGGVVQPARTHAAIVHFPIVLFLISVPIAIAALLTPQRGLLRVQLLVLFATIVVFCWAAEWSGEVAERQIPYGTDGVPGVTWEYLRQHTSYSSFLKRFAIAGVVLTGVSLLPAGSRMAMAVRIVVLSFVLCAALGGSATAIVAAHYGGELVYGQGLGSETLHHYLEEKSRANRNARKIVAQHQRETNLDAAAAALVGAQAGEERTIAGTVLCWCPPGQFDMGSPPSESERRPFEFQVTVKFTNGFWTGKYEVTQVDWKRVVGELPGETTDELPTGDQFPVGNVSFSEAEEYCAKLTELARASGELPAGWEFRLPTEAQWEYACRAGTTTATSFGDSIGSKQANTKGDQPYNGAEPGPTLGRAAKVGSYPANPWGIHDMHGNSCEWCRDWAHWRYPGGVDPDLHDSQATATRNEAGSYSRSRRGSCWADPAWASRSAFRQRFEPERRYDHIGFRVVLVRI